MNKSIDRFLEEKEIKVLILDLNCVITQTARVHAKAWKRMFDNYFKERGKREGEAYKPLNIETDYRQYIDDISRYDGVRNYLLARKVVLHEGAPFDKPGTETVTGLGNLKNSYFQEIVRQEGVHIYQDTVTWLKHSG